jgi:hypothetical protein
VSQWSPGSSALGLAGYTPARGDDETTHEHFAATREMIESMGVAPQAPDAGERAQDSNAGGRP